MPNPVHITLCSLNLLSLPSDTIVTNVRPCDSDSLPLGQGESRFFQRDGFACFAGQTKNLFILEQAKKAGVGKFAYISVFSNPALENLKYVSAHHEFEKALKASGLKYLIFRPVGFFTSFKLFYAMARFGIAPVIGSGTSRTNPLSENDLASLCIQSLEKDNIEIDLGGRQVYSRAGMIREMFSIRGVHGAVLPFPVRVIYLMLPFYHLLNPRFGELIRFFAVASTHEAVAPEVCSTTLGEYFNPEP